MIIPLTNSITATDERPQNVSLFPLTIQMLCPKHLPNPGMTLRYVATAIRTKAWPNPQRNDSLRDTTCYDSSTIGCLVPTPSLFITLPSAHCLLRTLPSHLVQRDLSVITPAAWFQSSAPASVCPSHCPPYSTPLVLTSISRWYPVLSAQVV